MTYRKTLGAMCIWLIVATCVVVVSANDDKKNKNIASEYLGVAIEEEMTSADILALLGPAIGNRAGEDAVVDRELRSGIFLTSRVHSKGTVVALQFSVSAGNTKHQRRSQRSRSQRAPARHSSTSCRVH